MKKPFSFLLLLLCIACYVNAAVLPLPSGVKDGINYNSDNTSVTLVLHAPGKTKVTIIGDFNSWTISSSYDMNVTPDGQKFWFTITGLTPGSEYSFQYAVDNSIRIADPYSEKILDPWNDGSINDVSGYTVYPNLKPYPTWQTSGYVSVIQTAKPAYNWTTTNYTRPAQNKLLVYELLVRDFVNNHCWKTLKDSLNYLQKLGINAIELMPFNEFDGNNSWGYNPNFYNAPDKYYGPDADLKAFIDECHKRGIAVIQDIVFNHAWGSSPLAALYWDGTNNRPAANNPWFNTVAPHPFGFGCDFNFSSTATRYYFQRILEYWLTEYKIDGFRFDLSKGFTNKNTGSDVAAWGAYDPERVANIKWLADIVWNKTPGSYVILEHLGDWGEENEFMNYKQGMMPWHRLDGPYNECTMGYSDNCKQDISQTYYKHNNAFSRPLRMGNIESHDEERLMYKNNAYGNVSGSYNVKTLATGLSRMQAASAFDLLITGPKMIWQFYELGYDYSINYCANGTTSTNCRTDKKPIRWDYLQNTDRKNLYNTISGLMKLKNRYSDVFATDLATGYDLGCNTFKFFQINNSTMNVTVIGNFDVVSKTKTINFQHTGSWTNYITGTTYNYTSTSQSITLKPGEFRVLLDKNITAANIDAVKNFSVYFKKPTAWPAAKIHYWNAVPSGAVASTTWPGTDMIKDCGDWYRYDFNNLTSINLLFHSGSGTQTADLFANSTSYYDNGWLAAEPAGRCNNVILHFKRPAAWGNTPYVYYWNTTPALPSVSWPGYAMVNEGNGWWKYTIARAACANIVFNNNTAPQTADLLNVCGEVWYDNGFVSQPAARPVLVPVREVINEKYLLYPNPVVNDLTIAFGITSPAKTSVILYDVAGRIVYKSAEQLLQPGNQKLLVQRNKITKGTYVVETRIGDTVKRNTILFQ